MCTKLSQTIHIRHNRYGLHALVAQQLIDLFQDKSLHRFGTNVPFEFNDNVIQELVTDALHQGNLRSQHPARTQLGGQLIGQALASAQ